MKVAALYVERGGPYFTMSDVDPWDRERDARAYDGPWPVVAHPPCGPWGQLRQFCKRMHEADCAPTAIESARKWGGVVEHPAWSRLWHVMRLPRPDELPDEHGGFTVEVDQVSWGHVARKRTWLYVVGAARARVVSSIRTGGVASHWIRGSRIRTASNAHSGGLVPDGIKICSAQLRRRTPPAFAAWLVDLARSAHRKPGGTR